MTCYAIHAWNAVFEANGAPKALVIPLKQGVGYTELASGDNGAANYGVWIGLLRVALDCVPRGTLVYSTRSGLVAHSDASLAKLTRFDRKDVATAISRLLEIGWLDEVPIPNTERKAPVPHLMDLIEELGGKPMLKGEDLEGDWLKAVKGLTPSVVRQVFRKSKIGISLPSQFIAVRKEQGL